MMASCICAVVLVAATLSLPLAAQLPSDEQRDAAVLAASSSQQDAQTGDVAADLGTGWNILQIPAAAFTPTGDTTWLVTSWGYIIHLGGGNARNGIPYTFWAPVFLSSGAGIGFVDMYAYDGHATENATAYLTCCKASACGHSASTSA